MSLGQGAHSLAGYARSWLEARCDAYCRQPFPTCPHLTYVFAVSVYVSLCKKCRAFQRNTIVLRQHGQPIPVAALAPQTENIENLLHWRSRDRGLQTHQGVVGNWDFGMFNLVIHYYPSTKDVDQARISQEQPATDPYVGRKDDGTLESCELTGLSCHHATPECLFICWKLSESERRERNKPTRQSVESVCFCGS